MYHGHRGKRKARDCCGRTRAAIHAPGDRSPPSAIIGPVKHQPVVAQQAREFLAPKLSLPFVRFARKIGGLYLRAGHGVRRVQTVNMEALYEAMMRFERRETRLIIVFRHVSVADGPVVINTISRELRRWCKKHGKPMLSDPHVYFLYGRGTLNWAGSLARWAFPRMGGIPVVNGIVDRQAQHAIRRVVTTGEAPLALAPEGQVTYHQFRAFPLVAGVAALSRWAYRAADDRRVEVLPIALGYRYATGSDPILTEAVRRIRVTLGEASELQGEIDADLLLRLTGSVLDRIEDEFPFGSRSSTTVQPSGVQERIDRICDQAAAFGERVAGLDSSGPILRRVFRLRYWIMSSLYREDIDLEQLGPLERSLADSRAAVAEAVRVYERLADLMEYLHVGYIQPRDSAAHEPLTTDGRLPAGSASIAAKHRLTEYALNLLDILRRAAGGDINTRWEPGKRDALVEVGTAIDASEVYAASPNARAAGEAINEKVTAEFRSLMSALEARLLA